MHSFILSLTLALDGSGWLTPRPGCFSPGKEIRYALNRRLGETQSLSERVRKIPLLTRFDPRTIQLLAGHYAIQAYWREEYVHQKWVIVCVYIYVTAKIILLNLFCFMFWIWTLTCSTYMQFSTGNSNFNTLPPIFSTFLLHSTICETNCPQSFFEHNMTSTRLKLLCMVPANNSLSTCCLNRFRAASTSLT
jgi:hypothetical protein